MTQSARLGDVVAVLEELYDPAWAEEWDAVGLVAGDPDARIAKVLFAIDPVETVGAEAREWQADLLVTHHPLFLRPVHGIAETTAKGRFVSALVREGIALHVAHTNADVADPGVSDALAETLDLHDVRPLAQQPADALDKVVTFVPDADVDKVIDALAAAGAGGIGDYSRCAWTAPGRGTFLPEAGAHPTIGAPGRIEEVAETRVEMVLPRRQRSAVVSALLAAHPYEEPAYDVFELASLPGRRGLGRIGELASAQPLAEFVERARRALPATAAGIRVAGDPARPVRRVAVCGGAGDSLLDVVRRSGADVYLTADLRHHPSSEFRADAACALVDAAHWATEWPWLAQAARQLTAALADRGASVETRVSRSVTDPWTGVVTPTEKEPL